MQEGMDKPSLLCMACALTNVGPRREIASLEWGEARSVECEYVLRDFRRDGSTWLGYIGDKPRTGRPAQSGSRGGRGRSASDTFYGDVGASIPLMPSMLVTFFSAQYWRMPSLPFWVDHWSMVGR